MDILLDFDGDLLCKYEKKGKPAYFSICLMHNGEYYPSRTWMDFGAVILGWWVMALLELNDNGGPKHIQFMDGPFKLKVETVDSRNALICSDPKENILWSCHFDAFAVSLSQAIATTIRVLDLHGVDSKERKSLEIGLRRLKPLLMRNGV